MIFNKLDVTLLIEPITVALLVGGLSLFGLGWFVQPDPKKPDQKWKKRARQSLLAAGLILVGVGVYVGLAGDKSILTGFDPKLTFIEFLLEFPRHEQGSTAVLDHFVRFNPSELTPHQYRSYAEIAEITFRVYEALPEVDKTTWVNTNGNGQRYYAVVDHYINYPHCPQPEQAQDVVADVITRFRR